MSLQHADRVLAAESMSSSTSVPQTPVSAPSARFAEEATRPTRIDWKGYWRSIVKRRWPLLAFALVMTSIAMLYAHSVQRVYRSTTTLLIESGKTKILSIEEVYNGVSQDREYYQTQVEILRSRDVALRTVISTKLWDEPEFDPRKPVLSWQARIRNVFSSTNEPPMWTPELLAEATVGKYLGAVTIEPVRLSQLVKISFDATDRKLAARIADATAVSFIESDRDARLKLNVSVTGQLQERLSALRDKLLQSEQELQKYREDSGLVSTSGSQGIASQQMSEISQRLVMARVHRTELENNYRQVERSANDNYASVSAVINQPGLVEARNRVSLASIRLDELTRTLGDENTRVIEARGTLAAAQKQVQAATRAVVSSLKSEVQAAYSNERALQAALDGARSAVQGVNRQEFQLGVLEREVQTNKQLYELLLSRTKETGVSSTLQGAVARIVDAASPGGVPVRPNKPQIVLSTLLLSLALGAIVAVLIDKFKRTVQGSDEAEQRLHQPILASLPEVRPTGGSSINRVFLDDPDSGLANGIRLARTNMLLSNFVVAHKRLLVTSALKGEGKTMFATNFALAHAQTKRTLLIDCDLRNPQVGVRLGLPSTARGITNLVLGNTRLEECVHNIAGTSLMVVPAGTLAVDTDKFLLSAAFQEALRALASRVDIVLIDSPPMSKSSDALILSQRVNNTIFVVKARHTPALMAQRGLEQLRRNGASVLGVVLTNMDPQQPWSLRRAPAIGIDDKSRTISEETAFGL